MTPRYVLFTDRHADIYTSRQTNREMEGGTDRQIDRQMDRQASKWTDRRTCNIVIIFLVYSYCGFVVSMLSLCVCSLCE